MPTTRTTTSTPFSPGCGASATCSARSSGSGLCRPLGRKRARERAVLELVRELAREEDAVGERLQLGVVELHPQLDAAWVPAGGEDDAGADPGDGADDEEPAPEDDQVARRDRVFLDQPLGVPERLGEGRGLLERERHQPRARRTGEDNVPGYVLVED